MIEPRYYRGVNLSGAEGGITPGVLNKDYTYPYASIEYYQSKGISLIRLPIHDARLHTEEQQDELEQFLYTAYMNDMFVLVDLHTYGSINGRKLGYGSMPEELVSFWKRFINRFGTTAGLWGIDLCNEPNSLPPYVWNLAAQHSINAVRRLDWDGWIVVNGDNWGSARDWRTANATLDVIDPFDRIMVAAHQYAASDPHNPANYKAWAEDQMYAGKYIDLIKPWHEWCVERGYRPMLSEFGVPRDAAWVEELERLYRYCDIHGISTCIWGGGPWWETDYPLRLDPIDGIDMPQMSVVSEHPTPVPSRTTWMDVRNKCR